MSVDGRARDTARQVSTEDGTGAGQRATVDRRQHRLEDDVAHLEHLVDALPAHPSRQRRRRSRPSDGRATSDAEQRLHAIGALLVTLQSRVDGTTPPRPAAVDTQPETTTPDDQTRHAGAAANGAGRVSTALAADSARYIARDLAARRLSAFTSAEGYRLARALATLGRVEAEVEHLLAEANTLTLHPGPLTDAVSHSAV
jgi:hypothetical protein